MSNEGKPIGIKEIAKMANVSIGTVDRVIHNRSGVSEKTRTRIQEIIKEVGYEPNPLARRLAGFSKEYRTAVIIPQKSFSNPYWGNALAGIEKAGKDYAQFGMKNEVILFDQNNMFSFEQAAQRFTDGDFDALILAPMFGDPSRGLIAHCNEQKIPVVLIDNDLPDSTPTSFIGQDAASSGALAAKLASYHVKENNKALIIRISGNAASHSNLNSRTAGFREYMINKNLARPEQILELNLPPDDDHQISTELERTLNQHPEITAIFAPNSRVFKVGDFLKRTERTSIFTIGYDLVEQNIRHLETGAVDVIISQKPANQCYQAIQHVYQFLILQQRPSRQVLTPIDLVFRENLPYYL